MCVLLLLLLFLCLFFRAKPGVIAIDGDVLKPQSNIRIYKADIKLKAILVKPGKLDEYEAHREEKPRIGICQ